VRGPESRPTSSHNERAFWIALAVIAALGLAWRVGYTLVEKGDEPLTLQSGDQIFYTKAGEALATGRGFVHPYDRDDPHAADHAPLTAIAAAPAALLTDKVILGQRLTMCLIGTATILALGLTGRSVGGNRTGLACAALAAIHPALWINDGLVMAESVGALTVVGVLASSLAAHRHPTAFRALLAGAAVGLAGLARAEALLLGPLLVVPVLLSAISRRSPLRSRGGVGTSIGLLAAAGVGAVAMIAPWVGPNLVRFEEPVTMSTNDGLTLLGSNCASVYSGGGVGLWSLACTNEVDTTGLDPSEAAHAYRDRAIENMENNTRRLPVVMGIRVMRVWSLWEPGQMVAYNRGEGRETWASWAGVYAFWALLPAGLAPIPIWRRRGLPLALVLGPLVAVTLTAATFYGLTRFRVTAEVALVLLVGVGIGALLDRERQLVPDG